MSTVLILFAHPRLEQSRTHRAMLQQLPSHRDLIFRDLYELYPDFNIDISAEKQVLEKADIIFWQHPLYWYSCPPLLKQWIDMVLEFGWAYGPGGGALAEKIVCNIFSSGGAREVYASDKSNRYTIAEFFRPFEQTARLCKMYYLPPYSIQGSHRISDSELLDRAVTYGRLVSHALENGLPKEINHEFLNDWFLNI